METSQLVEPSQESCEVTILYNHQKRFKVSLDLKWKKNATDGKGSVKLSLSLSLSYIMKE